MSMRASAERAAATITPVDFHARIGFLADDALRGRDTPSPGLEIAAAYIASEFRSFGLEPFGDGGTYFQRWPYVLRTLDLAATRLSGAAPLQYGSDFWALPGSVPSAEAPVTFLPSVNDTTIPAGSLAGRMVVVPAPGATGRQVQILANAARRQATRTGASAFVLVLDTSVGVDEVRARVTEPVSSRAVDAAAPVFVVRHEAAVRLLQGSTPSLPSLLASPRTVPLAGVTIHAAAPARDIDHRPPNVVGLLRGSDPALRETFVVISAHMDHVGAGRPDASGDSIFNGADDNASGTAAVLELAEAFAAMTPAPARSIVFLAVSGEEKGLLGAAYFADHPPVPIERIVANVNIDMIGRNAPDSAVIIGQEYSSLGPLAVRTAAAHPELGLHVGPDPWPNERFFFRSDHFHFARREVPALFFFTGVHADYHRPSDHVDKINVEKTARIGRLIFYVVEAVANDATAPAWTADGLAEVRRLTGSR